MTAVDSAAPDACPHCGKPAALCVCDAVAPVANRVSVLVLQHPQEQDRLLGTAGLAARILSDCVVRIGLSWPSLAKALGRPAEASEWAVLHLGSTKMAELPPGRDVVALDRKGAVVPDQEAALRSLKGIVVLDGSWAQAKTLWWRNAWVLKARRLALNPKRGSLYGDLRREPRRESLSTIEAIGLALAAIEGRPEIDAGLREGFKTMLARYRAAVEAGVVQPQSTRAGGGRRGRRQPRSRQ